MSIREQKQHPYSCTFSLLNAFYSSSALVLISFLGLLFIAFPPLLKADVTPPAIYIDKLSHRQLDQSLVLDSNIRFNLPESLVSAIHHEIPVSFKTQIILSEEMKLLGIAFNRSRKEIEYHTQLYTYGFNQNYVLYNSRNSNQQTFSTLEAALQTLGTLEAFPLIELSELHPEQTYYLKMKISLDHWQLPAPLVIDSLFEENWQVSSDWFEVKIETPKSWM